MSDSDFKNIKICETPTERGNADTKLVAEALLLHRSPDIGFTEDRLARGMKDDLKTPLLTMMGLEHIAETAKDFQTQRTAYRDLAVMDQAAALNKLGGPDTEGAKQMLGDTGAAKWIKKLEEIDPRNPDLKDLKTIQDHMSKAIDSPNSQDPQRRYNPMFDTTKLYANERANPVSDGNQPASDLNRPIGQFDREKVSELIGRYLNTEFLQAKNEHSIKAAANLQRFIDTAPRDTHDRDLLEKTIDKTDPETATRLRRAMLNQATIQFE
ncbi:MAG TPA: hypothetical protein V6C76_13635 [Drouetiella sp.]